MQVDDGLDAVMDADLESEMSFAELVAELALAYHDESVERPSLVEQIVAGAIAVVPGVVAAAVELRRGNTLSAPISEGDDAVLQLMGAQNDTGEGTCLQAWAEWRQILSTDVFDDSRWPTLGRTLRARQVQARAVVCTPMEVGGQKVGVLTLVSDQVDFGQRGEDEGIATLARVFAAHAAVALAGRIRHSDMVAALGSRDLIGQAKGILMERFKITSPAAFAMLVQASTRTNTRLSTVCEQLSTTGELADLSPRSRLRPKRDR